MVMEAGLSECPPPPPPTTERNLLVPPSLWGTPLVFFHPSWARSTYPLRTNTALLLMSSLNLH